VETHLSPARRLVTALCEEMRSGVIFMETSGQDYLPQRGIVSPNTRLKLACADFVRQWSYPMSPHVRADLAQHKPEELVNSMIVSQGMVIIVKAAGAVGEADETLPTSFPHVDPNSTLATPLPDLTDKVVKTGRAFPYFCATQLPRLTTTQKACVISLFNVNVDTDRFIWHESLTATASKGEVKASVFFRLRAGQPIPRMTDS
jgi:hypothetical protein